MSHSEMAERALGVLEEIMLDPAADDMVRLNAAVRVLQTVESRQRGLDEIVWQKRLREYTERLGELVDAEERRR